MNLFREPLLTAEFSRDEFVPEAGSRYLFAKGHEERSAIGESWSAGLNEVDLMEVEFESDDFVVLEGSRVALRNWAAIGAAISCARPLYIDITAMTYSVWAALLGASLQLATTVRVVYREPLVYQRSENPARGLIYDLSERITGVAPLPGLASLRRVAPQDSVLVPLLGFEGARLAHILEMTEPQPDRVVPIVGLPGFKPEYTGQALLANRLSFESESHHRRLRFAKANCPFDLFHELVRIQEEFDGAYLRIAPVGTKPHGLGAVMFALAYPRQSEIVYDHPVRSKGRSAGYSRVCVYEMSVFSESQLAGIRGPHARAKR